MFEKISNEYIEKNTPQLDWSYVLSAQWKNNTGERQFTGYKLRLMARNDERQGSLAVGGRGRHAPLEIYRPP